MRNILKLILVAIVLAIVALFLIDSDWEVSHEVDIGADVSIVWGLLVDTENYSEWNRYSPKVEGKISVGEVVWIEAHLDDEVQRVKNVVLTVKPEQELCWQSGGWYAYLARGTRCRFLTVTSDGNTRLVHHEVMSGPLAGLIERMYRDRIERGIALVDNSVAARAEQLAAGNL